MTIGTTAQGSARPAETRRGPANRDAWVEVDLGALDSNAATLRRVLQPGAKLGLVVKADAYGHGIEAAAVAAAACADFLVVATLDEAFVVRRHVLASPVLVTYPVPPSAAQDAARASIDVTVGGLESVRPLVNEWRGVRRRFPQLRLRVQVEVDTGLGRGGAMIEEVAPVVATLSTEAGIDLTGVWSHLSKADDADLSAHQHRLLSEAVSRLTSPTGGVPPLHLAASVGLLCSTVPQLDAVRVGLAWYGIVPDSLPTASTEIVAGLQPAMTVYAKAVRVAHVRRGASIGYDGSWTAPRPSTIATLPLGYGDGLGRSLSPGLTVAVRGRHAPVVGRISNDSLTVDVTDVDGLDGADTYVVLGGRGVDAVAVGAHASLRRTIEWEVLSSLTGRLARLYLRNGTVEAIRTLPSAPIDRVHT